MADPRRRKRKPRMPQGMDRLGDEAIERHYSRPLAPHILIEKKGDDWRFASPYAPEDEDRFYALLCQALGTRSNGVLDHFLHCFTRLCTQSWKGPDRGWRPSQNEFDAILAIVNALKPANEAQAALAAQLCALHLSAMKLGEACAQTRYPDSRTVAVLGKTVRAYSDGMESLARLQGKEKTVRQTIEVHYHDHKHAHFEGGAPDYRGQPHAADGGGVRRAALPGEDATGGSVPGGCGEGQARLPDARGSQGIRRSEG